MNEPEVKEENQPEVKEPLESEAIAKELDALEQKLDSEANPKPEEKNEEAVPPAKVEEKAAEGAEDEEPIPDKPGKEWFFKERQKRKQQREQFEAKILELSEKTKTLEERVSKPAEETLEKQERPQAQAGDIFRIYAKAANGEFTGNDQMGLSAEEQNARCLALAKQAILEEYDSSELEQVVREAHGGMFGSQGAEIAQMANQALSLALVRERKSERQEGVEREAQLKEKQQAEAEAQEMYTKYPAFKDKDSPEFKHISIWATKWAGESDAQGKITKAGKLSPEQVKHVVAHPMLLAELVLQDYRAGLYEGVLAQKQQLETKIDRSRQPEAGGRPSSVSGNVEPNSSAEILRKLQDQFPGAIPD